MLRFCRQQVPGMMFGLGLGVLSCQIWPQPAAIESKAGRDLSPAYASIATGDLISSLSKINLEQASPGLVADERDFSIPLELVTEEPEGVARAIAIQVQERPLPTPPIQLTQVAQSSIPQSLPQFVPVHPVNDPKTKGLTPTGEAQQLVAPYFNQVQAFPENIARRNAEQLAVRQLIREQMGHLTEDQQNVLFESLKDSPPAAASGILSLMKDADKLPGITNGPLNPTPANPYYPNFPKSTPVPPRTQTPQPSPELVPATETDVSAGGPAAKFKKLLEEEKNQGISSLPGYPHNLSYNVMTSEAGDGTLEEHTSLIMTRDEKATLKYTGIPLNFAIAGVGFFQLESKDGKTILTRNGNFTLDADRRIGLNLAGQFYAVKGLKPVPKVEGSGKQPFLNSNRELFLFDNSGDPSDPPAAENLLGTLGVVVPWSSEELTYLGSGLFTLKSNSTELVDSATTQNDSVFDSHEMQATPTLSSSNRLGPIQKPAIFSSRVLQGQLEIRR